MPQRKNSFFNPLLFLTTVQKLRPFLLLTSTILLLISLKIIYDCPADFRQGITVKIMFVHVPSAWLAMLSYIFMSCAALGVLIWKHPFADLALRAAVPIGACFTAIALITGAIWGKPTWGIWWVWDARLTSFFILFLFYLALLTLYHSWPVHQQGIRACALLTLIGAVNIPIIKFSVEWWNTLHQGASLLGKTGTAIDPVFLLPLLMMSLTFTFIFLYLYSLSLEKYFLQKQIHILQRNLAYLEKHHG